MSMKKDAKNMDSTFRNELYECSERQEEICTILRMCVVQNTNFNVLTWQESFMTCNTEYVVDDLSMKVVLLENMHNIILLKSPNG